MENRLQRVGMNRQRSWPLQFSFCRWSQVSIRRFVQQSDKTPAFGWDGAFTKEQGETLAKGSTLRIARPATDPIFQATMRPLPLTGSAFLSNWDGLTVGDLTERVRVSMRKISSEQSADNKIVDILELRVSQQLSGRQDRTRSKAEVLKQIRIEATKPKASSESKQVRSYGLREVA